MIGPDASNYADYLYWLHFANGTLQLSTSRNMFMRMAKVPADNPIMQACVGRREHAVRLLDDRSKENEWLAGKEFTAADIMTVVSLTTLRLFMPYSLEPYPHVLRWLERVGEREGYRRAMGKGDPGLEPLLGAEAPQPFM